MLRSYFGGIFEDGNQDGGKDMKANKKKPEIILRDGKPRAVILDIKEYQEMLERLEDAEDLRMRKT